MDRQPPPDLPDDFMLDDDHGDMRAVIWAAVTLVSLVVIATVLLWVGANA